MAWPVPPYRRISSLLRQLFCQRIGTRRIEENQRFQSTITYHGSGKDAVIHFSNLVAIFEEHLSISVVGSQVKQGKVASPPQPGAKHHSPHCAGVCISPLPPGAKQSLSRRHRAARCAVSQVVGTVCSLWYLLVSNQLQLCVKLKYNCQVTVYSYSYRTAIPGTD